MNTKINQKAFTKKDLIILFKNKTLYLFLFLIPVATIFLSSRVPDKIRDIFQDPSVYMLKHYSILFVLISSIFSLMFISAFGGMLFFNERLNRNFEVLLVAIPSISNIIFNKSISLIIVGILHEIIVVVSLIFTAKMYLGIIVFPSVLSLLCVFVALNIFLFSYSIFFGSLFFMINDIRKLSSILTVFAVAGVYLYTAGLFPIALILKENIFLMLNIIIFLLLSIIMILLKNKFKVKLSNEKVVLSSSRSL